MCSSLPPPLGTRGVSRNPLFVAVTEIPAVCRYRGDTSNMSTFPVLTSLKNTVIYHMGSICFGAFIIALIQLIR